MKKKLIIIIFVVFSLLIVTKIYHFIIIRKTFEAINMFVKQENRKYSVYVNRDDEKIHNENITMKDNILIHENLNYLFYEYKDFKQNIQYKINVSDKTVQKGTIELDDRVILYNLPFYIKQILDENNIGLKDIFEVVYIKTVTYNDKECYEMVVGKEKIIINKDTMLPVYSIKKAIKNENNNEYQIESTYDFDINNVDDEDIKLPDFTEYKILEN